MEAETGRNERPDSGQSNVPPHEALRRLDYSPAAEKTENYTATNNDDYLNFTDTAHDNDTCFLTSSINVGKVLTIRRDDTNSDVVLHTTGSICINGSCYQNYNLTGTTQSVVIICKGSNSFQIMIKGL